VTELGFAHHHAGEERAQGEGDIEQRCRGIGHPDRRGNHAEGKELARAGARDQPENARQYAPADDEHQRHEGRDLAEGNGESGQQTACRRGGRTGVALAAERLGQRRQQHQHQQHHDVLDDEPADGDTPVDGVERVAGFERAQHHDGARHRDRKPEHQRGARHPAPQQPERRAQAGGNGDLHDRAGNGEPAYRQQVVERKMQPDAEHQQHHAVLGQLAGEPDVGDEPRGRRADDDTGEQIAHHRRHAHARGEEAHHHGQAQARCDGRDELGAVEHAARWYSSSESRIAPAECPRLSSFGDLG
jgi:hypothetical protein